MKTLPAALVCLMLLAFSELQSYADVTLQDGRLVYRTFDNGDRVPDFSFAGYRAGEASIPDVPIVLVLGKPLEDNTDYIQSAIDHVASLPLNKAGLRGTVLLPAGRFPISGNLKISHSGVVLRGSGTDETVLVASGDSRRIVIEIMGKPANPVAGKSDLLDS